MQEIALLTDNDDSLNTATNNNVRRSEQRSDDSNTTDESRQEDTTMVSGRSNGAEYYDMSLITKSSSSCDDDDEDLVQCFNAIVMGMKCATLAIADEKTGSLARTARLNPWQEEALRIVTGSREEAHKPLSQLLKRHMNLTLDCVFDEHGPAAGAKKYYLDTQGYIAHNDESVVLAYHCTKSVFDWLKNVNTASTVWEMDLDIDCDGMGNDKNDNEGENEAKSSCLAFESLCGDASDFKPKVHAGFYHNFVATLPEVEEYVLPLLLDNGNRPPRKLYVVGHSLGAGIATLAASYFLIGIGGKNNNRKNLEIQQKLERHYWNKNSSSSSPLLHVVTSGSPRAIMGGAMKEMMVKKLTDNKNVQFSRIVRHKDVMATVPVKSLGFQHVGSLVHISRDGSITFDSERSEYAIDQLPLNAMSRQVNGNADKTIRNISATTTKDISSVCNQKLSNIPKAFRDHMLDFYLNPMKDVSNPGTFPDITDVANVFEHRNGSNISSRSQTLKQISQFFKSSSSFFQKRKQGVALSKELRNCNDDAKVNSNSSRVISNKRRRTLSPLSSARNVFSFFRVKILKECSTTFHRRKVGISSKEVDDEELSLNSLVLDDNEMKERNHSPLLQTRGKSSRQKIV